MASDWRTCTVDQIKANDDRAIAIGPFGSRMKADRYVAGGVPVIRGNNISDTRTLVGDFVFVSNETADELRSCNVFPGDLVFPHRGAIGQVGIVPSDQMSRYILSTSLMKLTCNQDLVDPLFIFYFFRSQQGRHALLQNASTVGTPGIGQPLASLRSISVPVPPLPEQSAIGHILGTLDDKIELNRRMNETLESIARALFKSWFVDFDPVRAKVKGRDPGLPKPLADVFPNSFEDSEIGEIPKGWRLASVDDLCRRVAMGPFGSDIKTDNFIESGVPVVRGSNLTNGFVENAFVFVSNDKADELRNANAFPGDIVITHRGTLGQVGLIPERSRFPRYVVSQSQMLLSVKRDLATPRYVFDFLRSAAGQHALLANTSQTGVPAIARPTTSVRAIRLLAPPIQVLRCFNQLVDPIYMRKDRGIEESRTLAALRDTLLPKLLSGEIRLSNTNEIKA